MIFENKCDLISFGGSNSGFVPIMCNNSFENIYITDIDEKHIKQVSKLIKNVNFINLDFEESFKLIKKTDFVYLDPPYAPENSKSFVGYTENGFSLEKHQTLFKLAKEHKFLMSNSDVKLVRDNFNDKNIEIEVILCKRSINSKKPNAKTNEVLIKN